MLEMKRKATKSGHEKRLEKKKNELKEAATASGQTSLLSSFGFTKSNTSSRPKTASPIDGESTSEQNSSTAVPVAEENYVIDDVDSDDTHADIGHGLGLADPETSKPDSASSKIDSTDDRWDPVTYAAMRDIVAKQEMKKTADVLKDCLCFSVQIDGSADKQQVDSKFITARLVPTNEVSVKTVFLGIASSDLGGAEGLLDSFISCLKSVGVETEKLVGVTTDGEKANTGKNAGLWTLLKQHIGRDILTAWCVCHRSDLALESVQSEVPELHLWMADVLALSTFFHSSPRRTKLLHKENDQALTFPKHFEVRDAAIVNLNVMKEMPVPGGQEEKYLKNLNSSKESSGERNIRKTSQAHRFVTSLRREDGPIRVEIVQSAINFLDQRMNIEQDETINNLKKILDASSPAQMINASRDLVSQLFGEDKVEEFVSDVCMSWTNLSKVQVYSQIEDSGTLYALKLRKMTEASIGVKGSGREKVGPLEDLAH
eukprot:gene9534-biopygen10963